MRPRNPPRRSPRSDASLHETASLAERVFDDLRRQIVELTILPETILTEAALAAEHEVSRAPAREALQRLATIGFVRAVPRVGYIVTGINLSDLDDIYAVRLELEPLAVRLAIPRLDNESITTLERLAQGGQRAAKLPAEKQGASLLQANTSFHREIAHISGNARLEQIVTALLEELERIIHMLARSSVLDRVLDEHLELVSVMRSGDLAAATTMMHEQLLNDYELLRDVAVNEGAAQSRLGASAG